MFYALAIHPYQKVMDEHAYLCKTFLGKDSFYLQKTMPVNHSQVLELHGVPFLQRSQLLPETGSNMSHFFTLCRGALLYP